MSDSDGNGGDDPEREADDWFEQALREGMEPEELAEDDDWFEQALREGEPAEWPGESAGDGEAERPAPEEPAPDPTEPESGEEDVFGQDFATAFENAPSPGGAGAEADDFGAGAPSGEGFDDADLESDIPRIDLGIEGLDEMIQGGVPERSLLVAIGGAGTGKTTFGLQFLHHALDNHENTVFIALEESRSAILDTADEKGWEFSEYLDAGQLAIVDLDPIEMANSLTSIRNELPALVREFGASRLVLDSVSLLEMMYEDPARRRNEIYDFAESLKRAGVTTMLTSETSETSPYNSRYGIIEYLTDAVFVLRYIRPEDFRETRMAIEIQKIRNANHSREMKPYEITDEGISVYRQANIF